MNREDAGDLRLRAAVESSPSGLLMIDEDGRIVLVNREVERLFGYSREELLGRPVEKLVPERFRERHPAYRGGFFASPSVRAMGAGRELFGRRKDGSEVPVEIGLTPVATADGFYVISSIVDITARVAAERERQDLEEQLRQSQKLEAVGRLAGGVAHDFNNILASIVGYGELARKSVEGSAAARDIDELLRAAERGRDLVERILRFSRRQEIRLRPIDLGQSIADSIRLLRPMLRGAIELVADLEQAPSRILADPTSVHQVLMNLVTNAADESLRASRIEIDARPFYVRDSFARAHPGLREGHYARIDVRDDGAGMDEATRGRVFEPFFTTKPPGSGSGLGLAMVHGIVQDHGGVVWIESELGRGTTVTCLIPTTAGELDPDRVATDDAASAGSERVLVVDDEPGLVEIGRRRLEALGYGIETATSVEAALLLLEAGAEEFDLVVTDYSMPRRTGVELAREIHRRWPSLRIVLMTGYIEEFASHELELAGIVAVWKKPLAGAELALMLRAVLDAEGPATNPS